MNEKTALGVPESIRRFARSRVAIGKDWWSGHPSLGQVLPFLVSHLRMYNDTAIYFSMRTADPFRIHSHVQIRSRHTSVQIRLGPMSIKRPLLLLT